ncbi:MAG: hypothetical protein ACREQZ_06770 [Woeseiaceae bacterium]
MDKKPFSRIVLAASALAPMTVCAANVYTQPQVDLRVEHNDNFNLSPTNDPDSDVYGYIADLATLVGIETPRSNTSLRPRVRLQEYPDRKDFENFEGFFDIASQYRGQRGNADVRASFSRQDVYNTETPTGDFDPIDPGGGEVPEAGPIIAGETRTKFDVEPTFEYKITERTRFGAGVLLSSARYDADGPTTKIDYDYGVFRSSLTWAVNPASDITVGAYTSRYETVDDIQETDAVGGMLGYAHRWSERTGIEARIYHEENDTTVFLPAPTENSTSNFGGEMTAYRRGEVSYWQLALGRAFIPTGDGGKSVFDQFRLEYERQLSPRLDFRGVARYDSRSGLDETDISLERDYARVDVSLKWFMTPTWYIGGGYAYIWVDRELAIGSGENNKLFLNFGYRGLSRAAHGSDTISRP